MQVPAYDEKVQGLDYNLSRKDCQKLENLGKWFPGRWYRVVVLDDTSVAQVYCETSDPQEATDAYAELLAKGKKCVLHHLWQKHQCQWRKVNIPNE